MSELRYIATPAATSAPGGAIVLLHGRGVDERNLVPFLGVVDPEHRFVHVTPGGPIDADAGGRLWYEAERVGFPDPASFRATYRLLDAFFSALPDLIGVPWERTVVGGFSQGAVMAYALGFGDATGSLPERPPPAGILAMSGFMASVPGFEPELGGRAGFPVCIAHGSLDPLIQVAFAQEARDRLVDARMDVTYLESAATHTIDPRSVPDIQRWLLERFS